MNEVEILDLLTPSIEEFAGWRGFEDIEEFDAPTANVETHLRLAASLFYLATQISNVPAPETALGAVIRAGIFDMAWFIGTSQETREEQFSPFSSERIGSYNYSKAYRAASNQEETGVPFFDLAVTHFTQSSTEVAESFALAAEHVFSQPFLSPERTWAVYG